ncbi:hypothetical protein [Nocardioides sp. InS609-2]|uniref:hypothetical protein n=1 Tax=Nocardioides sp. InS609-2 TaxID=2760705 RepID=UPI0020C1438F|nr:hypothetical protein [Nocardioides sp. InS609-2]
MSGVDARAPWVELRVHGVSGTPPADLLDRPRVKQVDGDVRSRFFRATDGDHHVLARRAPSPQPCVAGPTSSGTSWCSGRTRSTRSSRRRTRCACDLAQRIRDHHANARHRP